MIISALEARDFAHFVDDHGDIGGSWQGCLIYFFRLGTDRETLEVRTMTRTAFTADDVPRLYAFCNAWNHDRLWPKAYVHIADDGTPGSSARSSRDRSSGVTAGAARPGDGVRHRDRPASSPTRSRSSSPDEGWRMKLRISTATTSWATHS